MAEDNSMYDLESVYDEQIAPLMAQIIAICKEHRLPMVASFQYQRDEEIGYCLCTTSLPFKDREIDPSLNKAMLTLKPVGSVSMSRVTVVKADGSREITMIANLDGE